MSVTDDERREVAEDMRKMASQSYPLTNLVLSCFIRAEKGDPASLWNRLADLIEPEERTCHIKLCDYTDSLGQKMYRCSECGALMTDDACFFEGELDVDRFSYCPSCGAKVVAE